MALVDPKNGGVVLLVDDDDDYRAIIRGVLERERYFVLDAHDGQDALDVLRSAAGPAIRLIVLDLDMPGMSGWQLLEILRADSTLSRIPVLVTSGVPIHGDASGIAATTPWLGKPVAGHRLVTTVSQLLTRVAMSHRPALRTPA